MPLIPKGESLLPIGKNLNDSHSHNENDSHSHLGVPCLNENDSHLRARSAPNNKCENSVIKLRVCHRRALRQTTSAKTQ